MEKTGISYKTTTWLFKNYLHKNLKLESYERPQFYNDDIYKIKMLQIGFFDIKNELKKLPGYEIYWLSPHGKIFTYSRGFFEEFKTHINCKNGYVYVNLYDNNLKKHKSYRFHRLLASVFIQNPDNKPTVNHIDGNKINNDISNLEWMTVSENTQHAFDNSLAKNAIGDEDSQSMPIDIYYNNGNVVHFGSCHEANRHINIPITTILRLAKSGKISMKYKIKIKFSVKEKV